MVSEEIKVINPSGLHLRPAGNLCKEALRYDSKINIIFGDATANVVISKKEPVTEEMKMKLWRL